MSTTRSAGSADPPQGGRAPTTRAVALRAAREADLDRLIEIHTACYPDDRGADARRQNLLRNSLGSFEDFRVAEREGRIVGHGFGFSLTAFFGGAPVSALGIASVGVAPEARGTGVGQAIVRGLEQEARSRGAVVALLHAYRHGFYARLGYADVTPNRRLSCDPRAVPRSWVTAARDAGIRAASGEDIQRIVALYAEAARRATGWIERSEVLWTRRFANPRRQFFVLDDAGYLCFETLQQEPHAPTRIAVWDLVAKNDEAKRLLWGFLGMQAGQVVEIEIEIAADDPILFALTDVDGARFGEERVEHDLGQIVAGPMIRMLDVRAALAVRGYGRPGTVDVALEGDAFRLRAGDGHGVVESPINTGTNALALDERTLASVAFGGLRARDAVQLGLASGPEAVVAQTDELFAGPAFYTLDRF